MIVLDQDEVKQNDFGREEQPDPNIYQPDEQDDEAEFDRRIRQVHERLRRLSIVGAPDIEVEGAWDSGYAVKRRVTTEGTGQSPPPPPPPMGACCVGEDCSITSSVYCALIGGTYQGNGTDCTPNPCLPPPATGACCIGTDCSIQTQPDCVLSGGTYYGDSSTCDPNPCSALPSCSCGFPAFDGSGRMFLTLTATGNVNQNSNIFPFGMCTLTISGTEVVTFNPVTCDMSVVECSASGNYSFGTCDEELTFNSCTNDLGSTVGCCLATPLDCGDCPGACDQVVETIYIRGIAPFSPFVVADATHASRDCSNDDDSEHVDLILSDECSPV